jgi:hypothetical protein
MDDGRGDAGAGGCGGGANVRIYSIEAMDES